MANQNKNILYKLFSKYSEYAVVMSSIIVISVWVFNNFTKSHIHSFRIDDNLLIIESDYTSTIYLLLITLVAIAFFCFYLNYIKAFIIKKRFTNLIIFLSSSVIISLMLYHDYIFGDSLFMFYDIGSDTINGYYPRLYYFVDHYLDLPFYTFHDGLGKGYLISLISNTTNPFMSIFLLFGTEKLAESLIYINISKIIASGLFFYYFLRLLIKDGYTSLIFSILFAFNGFIMLWGQHYHFATNLVYFAFLLYSTELYFARKKVLWLLVAIILSSFSLYFFYQYMIFISIYILFRQFFFEQKTINIAKGLFKYYGFVLVAFLLVAFIHLPTIYSLLDSPRINLSGGDRKFFAGFFNFQSIDYYITTAGRFFSNDLAGGPRSFFGWTEDFGIYRGNYYEAPQLYSGILSLLLMPQLFKLNNKHKRIACIILLLLSVSLLIFPAFAVMFNGFQYSMYRWTYGIIAFNLIITAIVFSEIVLKDKLSKPLLLGTYIVLIVALVFIILYINQNFAEHRFSFSLNSFWVAISFLTFYFVFLFFAKQKNSFFKLLLLIVICSELIAIHYASANDRGTAKKGNIPYFDNTIDLVSHIKQTDTTFVYRVDKNYFSQRENDALAQDYYGIKSYSSVNPRGYVEFCNFFGLSDGLQIRRLPNTNAQIGRYNLLDVLSVKYMLSKRKLNVEYYELIEQKENIYLYKNYNSKPFGFAFDRYILENEISEFPYELKDVFVHSYLIIRPEDEIIFKNFMLPYNYNSHNKLILKYAQNNNVTDLKDLLKTENVDINHVGLDKGNTALHWAVKRKNYEMVKLLLDNGARADLINIERKTPFDLSKSKGNSKIENLLYENFDKNSFDKFEIEDFKQAKIIGSFESEKNSTLFFSIPYDKGWKINVNGESTDYFRVNAGLIGVPVNSGDHIIELKYLPPYFFIGILISLVTLAGFVSYIVLNRILISKKHFRK